MKIHLKMKRKTLLLTLFIGLFCYTANGQLMNVLIKIKDADTKEPIGNAKVEYVKNGVQYFESSSYSNGAVTIKNLALGFELNILVYHKKYKSIDTTVTISKEPSKRRVTILLTPIPISIPQETEQERELPNFKTKATIDKKAPHQIKLEETSRQQLEHWIVSNNKKEIQTTKSKPTFSLNRHGTYQIKMVTKTSQKNESYRVKWHKPSTTQIRIGALAAGSILFSGISKFLFSNPAYKLHRDFNNDNRVNDFNRAESWQQVAFASFWTGVLTLAGTTICYIHDEYKEEPIQLIDNGTSYLKNDFPIIGLAYQF